MITLAQLIESIQPDIFYKLCSESFFAPITIFKVREHRIDAQVLNSLKGMGMKSGVGSGAGAGGAVNANIRPGSAVGCTIEVLMPSLSSGQAEAPGPVGTIQQMFLVKENPTVNLGLSGTQLTAEAVAGQIVQALHKFSFGDQARTGSFYPAPNFFQRLHSGFDAQGDPNLFLTMGVTMQATLEPDELAQTAQPAISSPEQTVTLTDQQPGGGSDIYYTTDGSFPGSANPQSALYNAPFTVESGTVLRVAAYAAGFAGSMIKTVTID